jgi:hypothetical protein
MSDKIQQLIRIIYEIASIPAFFDSIGKICFHDYLSQFN